ncbi:diguanylate cyclase [Robinsoniella peoriensis]|uniref:diguanylate cyclase n=1 Tax=Robinsoniella peoriensis TaxID=180332 RepID=UPI00375138C5
MKKRIIKYRSVFLVLVLLIAAIVAGVICVDFTLQTNNNSQKLSMEITARDIQKKCINVSFILDDHFSDLESLATTISRFDQYENEELMDILAQFGNHHDNCRVSIADPLGRTYEKDREEVSIADRDYFKSALKGGRIISDLIKSRVTGEYSIVFAVPVYREGKAVGVLRTVYQNIQLNRLLHVSGMDAQENAYIVQRDGTIALSMNGELCGENIEAALGTGTAQDKIDQIHYNMGKTAVGNLAFEVDDFLYYCNYAPVPGGKWYLFNISSASKLGEYTSKSTVTGMLFMGKMVVLFLIIMGGILCYLYFNNKQMRKLANLLENVSSHAPGGMFRYDPKSMQLSFINNGLYQMLGCREEDFKENYHNNYLELVYDQDRQMVLENIEKMIPDRKSFKMRFRLNSLSSPAYWVQQVSNIFEEDGELHVYGILVDIAEYKAFEDELSFNNQRYKIIVNQMESCFVEYDVHDMRVLVMQNFEEIFGRMLKMEIESEDGKEFVYEEDWNMIKDNFKKVLYGEKPYEECEARIKKGDETYLWCLIRFYSMVDENGAISRLICKINNIDKRKRRSIELESKVQKDPMTGLYNKSVSKKLIEDHLESAPDDIQGLFVLDIDNFKGINDTYGHHNGDRVLNMMAQTLHNLFRKSDVVGRIGGDEFIVCMKDCYNEEYAMKKAGQLSHDFAEITAEANLAATCSIGVALYPKHGKDWDELFEKADIALYQAKRCGKNQYAVYCEKGLDEKE